MSKHDPRLSLNQMREAAHRAHVLCEGTTLEKLRGDWIRLTAFERQHPTQHVTQRSTDTEL